MQKVPLVAAVFRANGKRDRADEPARSFWASSFMNHYKGQIVVPGLGFYGRDSHTSRIRENRLFAGVSYLDKLKKKRRKVRRSMTPKFLRNMLGRNPTHSDNPYNTFIQGAMAE